MRKYLVSFSVASCMLFAAGTANAGDTAKTTVAATPAAAKSDERKICRRMETSGSRMAERVCLTKSEWIKLEQEK